MQIHSYKDKYTITKKFTQIQRGDVRKGATLWECLACAVMRMEEVGGSDGQYSGGLLGGPGGFDEHVKRLRGTMFYVCKVGSPGYDEFEQILSQRFQGSCLCGTVSNRGKVIINMLNGHFSLLLEVHFNRLKSSKSCVSGDLLLRRSCSAS